LEKEVVGGIVMKKWSKARIQATCELFRTGGQGNYLKNHKCRTGRSTALALGYILEAINNPDKIVYVEDHYNTHEAHRHLLHMIEGMIRKLELSIIIDESDLSICASRVGPLSVTEMVEYAGETMSANNAKDTE
jgi:hypothetical protein